MTRGYDFYNKVFKDALRYEHGDDIDLSDGSPLSQLADTVAKMHAVTESELTRAVSRVVTVTPTEAETADVLDAAFDVSKDEHGGKG